jgi:hypothetical protein
MSSTVLILLVIAVVSGGMVWSFIRGPMRSYSNYAFMQDQFHHQQQQGMHMHNSTQANPAFLHSPFLLTLDDKTK